VTRGKRVVRGNGEDEAEGIFAVEVETEQPFLSDETERFVQAQGRCVVKLGLKYNFLDTILLHLLHRLPDERCCDTAIPPFLMNAEHGYVAPIPRFPVGALLADYTTNGDVGAIIRAG